MFDLLIEELNLVLQQIANKNVVCEEEIVQIDGIMHQKNLSQESAWILAAKSIGISVVEFEEFVSERKIPADFFLPKFISCLQKLSATNP